jgi:hypothetical protein
MFEPPDSSVPRRHRGGHHADNAHAPSEDEPIRTAWCPMEWYLPNERREHRSEMIPMMATPSESPDQWVQASQLGCQPMHWKQSLQSFQAMAAVAILYMREFIDFEEVLHQCRRWRATAPHRHRAAWSLAGMAIRNLVSVRSLAMPARLLLPTWQWYGLEQARGAVTSATICFDPTPRAEGLLWL